MAFWLAAALFVGWLALNALSYGTATGFFGEKGSRLVDTLLLGVMAFSAGLLALLQRRANPYNEPEHQWTPAELFYALALFGSLLFGIYSFFDWYYAP